MTMADCRSVPFFYVFWLLTASALLGGCGAGFPLFPWIVHKAFLFIRLKIEVPQKFNAIERGDESCLESA